MRSQAEPDRFVRRSENVHAGGDVDPDSRGVYRSVYARERSATSVDSKEHPRP